MTDEDQQYAQDVTAEAEMQGEAGWTPLMNVQSKELTRHMLDPDDIIEQIEHELRGEDFDYQKNEWIPMGSPIVNERGVRAIISRVRWFVNRGSYLTNLDDPQIYEIVYNISNNLAELVFNNGDEWNLDWRTAQQNNIVDDISTIVFMSLRRSFEQGERRFLGSHTKILHRIDETPQKQDKKFGLF